MRIINCAVVDDEPIARQGLREFIDQVDFLCFKGFANDVQTTITLLEKTEIDLLFLDINMPGISGIDFIKTFTGKKPLIVFVTAYPNFAVESYNLNSLDYLMKPVSFERFKTTADKALKALPILQKDNLKKDYLFVKCEGLLEKVNISEIVYIASMQNYIKIHLSNRETFTVHLTLKKIHSQLDAKEFIMVHKCYIVHISFINSISGNQIKLKDFGNIPIGRIFRPNINSILINNPPT